MKLRRNQRSGSDFSGRSGLLAFSTFSIFLYLLELVVIAGEDLRGQAEAGEQGECREGRAKQSQ